MLFDADLNYQYRAFGVPQLGFKRHLDQDSGVAPYASLLALSLRHARCWRTSRTCTSCRCWVGMACTSQLTFHPPAGTRGDTCRRTLVHGHHQGMILLSVVNYLQDDVMVRRFHSDPLVRSVQLLLQEKVPYDAPLESPRPEDAHAGQPGAVHVRS